MYQYSLAHIFGIVAYKRFIDLISKERDKTNKQTKTKNKQTNQQTMSYIL